MLQAGYLKIYILTMILKNDNDKKTKINRLQRGFFLDELKPKKVHFLLPNLYISHFEFTELISLSDLVPSKCCKTSLV